MNYELQTLRYFDCGTPHIGFRAPANRPDCSRFEIPLPGALAGGEYPLSLVFSPFPSAGSALSAGRMLPFRWTIESVGLYSLTLRRPCLPDCSFSRADLSAPYVCPDTGEGIARAEIGSGMVAYKLTADDGSEYWFVAGSSDTSASLTRMVLRSGLWINAYEGSGEKGLKTLFYQIPGGTASHSFLCPVDSAGRVLSGSVSGCQAVGPSGPMPTLELSEPWPGTDWVLLTVTAPTGDARSPVSSRYLIRLARTYGPGGAVEGEGVAEVAYLAPWNQSPLPSQPGLAPCDEWVGLAGPAMPGGITALAKAAPSSPQPASSLPPLKRLTVSVEGNESWADERPLDAYSRVTRLLLDRDPGTAPGTPLALEEDGPDCGHAVRSYDALSRPVFSTDAFFLRLEGCDSRSLVSDGFFEDGSEWTLSGGASIGSAPSGADADPDLGQRWLDLNGQSAASKGFSFFPARGEPFLAVALLVVLSQPCGFSLEVLGAGASWAGQVPESSSGEPVAVALPVCVPRLSSGRVRVSISSGRVAVKAIQVLPGLSAHRYEYHKSYGRALSSCSYGGLATLLRRDPAGRVSYACGGSRTGVVSYEGTDLVPASEVADMGEGRGASYWCRASQQGRDYKTMSSLTAAGPSGASKSERSFDGDTWKVSSLTEEGIWSESGSNDSGELSSLLIGGLLRKGILRDPYGRPSSVSASLEGQSGSSHGASLSYPSPSSTGWQDAGGASFLTAHDLGGALSSTETSLGSDTGAEAFSRCSKGVHLVSEARLSGGSVGYGYDPDLQGSWSERSALCSETRSEGQSAAESWAVEGRWPGEFLSASCGGYIAAASSLPDGRDGLALSDSDAEYLSLRSYRGGSSLRLPSASVGVCSSSAPYYMGDRKTWHWAMALEGYLATRMFDENGDARLYGGDGSAVAPSGSASVSRADESSGYGRVSALAASYPGLSYALPGEGYLSVALCFYWGSAYQSVLSVSFGGAWASLSVSSSGSSSLSASWLASPAQIGDARPGWNAFSLRVSALGAKTLLNGLPRDLQAAFQPCYSASVTVKAGATFSALAARLAGAPSDPELADGHLLLLDLCGPMLVGGASSASYRCAGFSRAPEFGGSVSLPFRASLPDGDGVRLMGFAGPGRVGGPGLPASLCASGIAAASPFEYSPALGCHALRCFGQWARYSLPSGASTMTASSRFVIPACGWAGRRVLLQVDSAPTLTLSVESGELCLRIDSELVRTGLSVAPGAAQVAGVTYATSVTSSGSLGPTYQFRFRAFLGQQSFSGTREYSYKIGHATLCVGAASGGGDPLLGLVSDVRVCMRELSQAQAQAWAADGGLESRVPLDSLGRPLGEWVRCGAVEGLALSVQYEFYSDGGATYQTSRPASVSSPLLSPSAQPAQLSHDAAGRLSTAAGEAIAYDARGFLTGLGQLSFGYDGSGNILSVSAAGAPVTSFFYLGGACAKRLCRVESQTAAWEFSYQGAGLYPSSVSCASGGVTEVTSLSYSCGRLYSASKGGATVSYAYDENGFLRRRSVGSQIERFRFAPDGRLLCHVLPSGRALVYLYSGGPAPFALIDQDGASGKAYLIERDWQGRVVSVVDPSDGSRAAYSYGAWGEPTLVSDSTASGIGSANRLLYKGYLYDPFLGMYCLGERHYAPWACRFIEPDRTEYVDPGESLCVNLYAYCGNDPIAYLDPSGHMHVIFALLILGAIGAATGFAVQSISDLATGKGFDWGRSGIAALSGFIGGMAMAIPVWGTYVSAALTSGLNTIGQMAYSRIDYSGWDYVGGFIISALLGLASSSFFSLVSCAIPFAYWTDVFASNYVGLVTGIGGAAHMTGIVAARFTLELSGRMFASNMISSLFDFPFSYISDQTITGWKDERRRIARQQGWDWLW